MPSGTVLPGIYIESSNKLPDLSAGQIRRFLLSGIIRCDKMQMFKSLFKYGETNQILRSKYGDTFSAKLR